MNGVATTVTRPKYADVLRDGWNKSRMALPAALVLSGLPPEQFSDVRDLFNHGAVLLKSPSSSSIASTGTSASYQSVESGISSMSAESCAAKNLEAYFDMLAEMELEETTLEVARKEEEEEPNPETKVIYDNRDILNLGSNINSKWEGQPAVLQGGVNGFFENRSQYSRVNGAAIPRHLMVTCEDEDCDFKLPLYY